MASTAANNPAQDLPGRLSIFALATTGFIGLVGLAFAAGWLIGRMLV